LHRPDLAHHPRLRARGAERGLHPHRARQGTFQPRRADAPCAAQRRGAHPDRDRPRHRHPDRRRRDHRERVRPAGPGPPHRRGGAEPRLPDHPDRHPDVLGGLRGDQPADRHQLHPVRSEDPLLTVASEEIVDSASIAAASAKRRSLWLVALRNPNVIIGGGIPLGMVAVRILAPLLGALEPTPTDPAARNKKPGTEITLRLDDGTAVKRVALMGTDSLGRDVYSRVLYGARVSLAVGVSVALIAIAIGIVVGLISGYIRWLDGIVMR